MIHPCHPAGAYCGHINVFYTHFASLRLQNKHRRCERYIERSGYTKHKPQRGERCIEHVYTT